MTLGGNEHILLLQKFPALTLGDSQLFVTLVPGDSRLYSGLIRHLHAYAHVHTQAQLNKILFKTQR